MIRQLWESRRQGQQPQSLETLCSNGTDWFYLAVMSFVDGDDDRAARYAARAESIDASPLHTEAARYLTKVGKQGRQQVYTSPEGFAAFIRGGGNVTLYQQLSKTLGDKYRQHQPQSLLDVGVGDGLALLPALNPDVAHVDLLEPSATLLDSTAATLRQRGIPHRAANTTLQALIDGAAGWPGDSHWDLTQATFSLHNVSRADRRQALAWLREHTDRLLIAEFDLSPGKDCEPEWFEYVVTHYRAGLAEYDGDGGVVAQGFLMPIMFGYFDPDTVHHEQSLSDWREDLELAGFTDIQPPQLLHHFWWAPGYLMDAA